MQKVVFDSCMRLYKTQETATERYPWCRTSPGLGEHEYILAKLEGIDVKCNCSYERNKHPAGENRISVSTLV